MINVSCETDISRVKVKVVDTDVHPAPSSTEQMAMYIPEPFRSRVATNPRRQQQSPAPNIYYYDVPDFVNTTHSRYDSQPPSGGPPCSDPDFTYKQLIIDAKVDLGILAPLVAPALLPELDTLRYMTLNNWLVHEWLSANNQHGRWRGCITICGRDPIAGAREIERMGDHPLIVQAMIGHTYTGGRPLGSRYYDPIFAAATKHGLPVGMHSGPGTPFEFTPISPVGQGSHIIEFYSNSITLLFAAHVMSLVFDGAFERFPDLRFVFVEGAFTWLLPLLWRMDAYWKARRGDLPLVKRKPSEYVKEHIRICTQPLENPDQYDDYRQYIEWLDPASLLMFSTDYPHWTFDDPAWAARRFPKSAVERVMATNAIELYGLPDSIVDRDGSNRMSLT